MLFSDYKKLPYISVNVVFFSDKLGLFFLRLGQYKKLFSFGRKSFFYKIMLNLYISGVGLKSSLSKLNQQSSLVTINFSFYGYQQLYEKFVLENVLELFKLGARKFHFPRYKKFFQSSFFFFRAQKVPSWNIRKIWG